MKHTIHRWSCLWVAALLSGMSATAQATLIGVLPATSGGTDYQAYYDPNANLTWLADFNVNGQMSWSQAVTWAASLNINGVTGWTLPTTAQPDTSCSNYNSNSGEYYGAYCTGSEMGNLYYNVLGNTLGSFTNSGPFTNIKSYYWSTTYDYDTSKAWAFRLNAGVQNVYDKISNTTFHAVAVLSGRPGSAPAAAAPEPGTLLLMGAGLVGLAAQRRRTRAFPSARA